MRSSSTSPIPSGCSRRSSTNVANELEVKAVVDAPDGVRARLLVAGATAGFTGTMTDRRYDRRGELGRRDEVLRIRRFEHPDGRVEAHLSWKGPTRRTADGYKQREELEYSMSGAQSPGLLLEQLGYEISHAIDRRVEYFALGAATLRLEWYPRMDVLLEVEGPPDAIEAAITAAGLPREEFGADSLVDFAARYERRTGAPAVLAATPATPLPAAAP